MAGPALRTRCGRLSAVRQRHVDAAGLSWLLAAPALRSSGGTGTGTGRPRRAEPGDHPVRPAWRGGSAAVSFSPGVPGLRLPSPAPQSCRKIPPTPSCVGSFGISEHAARPAGARWVSGYWPFRLATRPACASRPGEQRWYGHVERPATDRPRLATAEPAKSTAADTRCQTRCRTHRARRIVPDAECWTHGARRRRARLC